jgi:single-stranded-DNA-specific exonuclease
VAIGTVADLAALTGENRTLVKGGIERIRRQNRLGLLALAGVAGINLGACDSSTIGFGLGPRLNAAGRMETAMNAFELLTTRRITSAPVSWRSCWIRRTASARPRPTKSASRRRRGCWNRTRTRCCSSLPTPRSARGWSGWRPRAWRRRYYRPAIVAHQGETFTVGSCRSIPEFHITHALDECADLLVRHGGHAAAAGFTVRNERVPELVEQLMAIAARELAEVPLEPVIDIDREIKLDKLNAGFIAGIFNDLHLLEPTGRGNPEPVFASYNVAVRHARTVGMEGKHLKLTLQAGGSIYDAIAFQQGHWLADMPERIDIAYRFEENSYMGRVTTQLNVRDIRVAE